MKRGAKNTQAIILDYLTNGVRFVARVEIFHHYLQISLGPTQLSVQGVLGVLFPKVKQMGCTATHSPLLVPEFKNEWSYNSSPLYIISCNVGN
jgi:hypothetical protein